MVLSLLGTFSGMAGLTISVGTHTVTLGSNTVQIPIQITGGDLVTDMAAGVQIGLGGPLLGKPAGPKIISISYAGSVWSAAPGGFDTFATVALPAEIYDPNVAFKTSGQRVAASGLLFTLTIDTTGFGPGVYDFKLAGVGPTNATFSTQFQNSGTNVPVTIVDGQLAIVTNFAPAAPTIQISSLAGGQARISLLGQSGLTYRIQWRANLESGNWNEVPVDLTGNGGESTWVDNGTQTGQLPGLAARRFYRVRVVTASGLPSLRITNETNGDARLIFNSETGRTYRVQWVGSLGASWNEIPSDLSGTGADLSWVDDGTLTGQSPKVADRRFYRIRLIN